MIIYISGAYSADTQEQTLDNILLAEAHALQIWNMGHSAMCPHLNTKLFECKGCKAEHAHYLEFDMRMLCACEAIFMLPNWQASVGAGMEIELARRIGMPIYYELSEIPDANRPVYLETLLKYYDEFIAIERQRLIANSAKYKDDWKHKDCLKEATYELYDMAGYAALQWAQMRLKNEHPRS
jgi:hypothetical protein